MIVQEAFGQINGAATFTITLPAASSASNRVVAIVIGNTTVTTPSGWTLDKSAVNNMGSYGYSRTGGLASYVFVNAAGQLNWYAAEIDGPGTFDVGGAAETAGAATTLATPSITPTAGDRIIFAAVGASGGTIQTRTASGWTNGFIEHCDQCVAASDDPMGAVAALLQTANGSTAINTTATYSAAAMGARTGLTLAYRTPVSAAAAAGPVPQVITRVSSFRSSLY